MLIKDADRVSVGTETRERWGVPRFCCVGMTGKLGMVVTDEDRLIKLQGQMSALLL